MNPTLKKVLRIFFYGIIFFIIEHFFDATDSITKIQFSYANPLMVFVSVVQGPVVGALSITFGEFLEQIIHHESDWIFTLISAINCAWIGYGMRNVDIHNGFFERADVSHFNKVQLFSNIVCWLLLRPFLNYYLIHANIWDELRKGFWVTMGYFLSNLIAATIFLALYARSRVSAANFYRN